ncbi:MAG: hypothetical protein JOZ72_11435 [Alphaproteobacteria bacterium]|nr:hypothetical protein [Alphaproteobacteria bacterium]
MQKIVIAAAAAFATLAGAWAGPVPVYNFCGVVSTEAAKDCTGVRPSDPKDPFWDITGANPMPALGTTIRGSGQQGTSICNQYKHLDKVTWQKVTSCSSMK